MPNRLLQALVHYWRWLLIIAVLGGYWLLPVSGRVLVIPERSAAAQLWPEIRPEPAREPGQQTVFWVTDVAPWAHVRLTVNGRPAQLDWARKTPGGTWTWRWTLAGNADRGAAVVFYHDCHTGCVERGRLAMGSPAPTPPAGRSTKLGVAFADPERDWHGRSGWVVDLTYVRLAEEDYWGADELATRVEAAAAKGLRVLVRVDYDRNQSLPPAGDYQALSEYLQYLQRLARDARLRGVYGYIIGTGYNALSSNAAAPERPVTPAWYARLFNGYGEEVARTDNVLQVIRAENLQVRVLVGPVQPWTRDQRGESALYPAAPWLSYMDSLVAALDEGAQAKAAGGVPLAAPDGFALSGPGRPDAPEMAEHSKAEEPALDLPRQAWGGAQAGFRAYRDWLAVINRYPSTRGLPAYITASNTFAPDEGVPPAQNYPRGWLTTALREINREPQVQALCWFMDGPLGDRQWDAFSLRGRQGRMAEVADEFDALLREGD